MTDSGGSGGVMGFPSAGPEMSFEPFFKMWSEWLRTSMGPMSAVPGASVPWLTKPGISTGEEVEPLPQGAIASDPLLSALDKAQEANPLRNLIPLDWVEITRALQTLWMREMSNPARAMQVATDFNRRLFEKSMEVWGNAAARFWGMQQEEEEGTSDPRFSAAEWDSKPFYEMLKETYFLASEYLLNEAQETADGKEDTEEQKRLRFHLQQFVEAMAPVNFLCTTPEAVRRAFETGGASLAEGAPTLLS